MKTLNLKISDWFDSDVNAVLVFFLLAIIAGYFVAAELDYRAEPASIDAVAAAAESPCVRQRMIDSRVRAGTPVTGGDLDEFKRACSAEAAEVMALERSKAAAAEQARVLSKLAN